MDVRVIVEPRKDAEGWYWAIKIDGGIYAEGEESTKAEAEDKSKECFDEWRRMNA